MTRSTRLSFLFALCAACAGPDEADDDVIDTENPALDADDDTDDDADQDDEDVAPDEAPRIVAMTPAMDAVGVLPDATIELRFSVPMDAESVAGALNSVVLGEHYTLSWPEPDRLVITPDEALPVRAWDPDGSLGAEVDIGLAASAMSAAGVPLDAPYWASFRVAQSYAQTVRHVDALTGRVDHDGTASTVAFQVGDSGSGAIYRAFATFDLAEAPEILGVRQAVYGLDITTITGTPFQTLGALQLHAVRYADLASAFDESPIGPGTEVAQPAWQSHVLVDLTETFEAAVADREAAGDLVQLRLAFTIGTDGDDDTDYAIFQKNGEGPELAVDLLVE